MIVNAMGGSRMKPDQLNARLARLLAGESELLNGTQFNNAFPGLPSLEEQKAAASELAETHNCAVTFIGKDDGFAVFVRRQDRKGAGPASAPRR